MKRIKIMLTVVIVLGAVGGALAFKAKRTSSICTAAVKADGTCGTGTLVDPFPVCDGGIVGKITAAGGNLRCTTTLHPVNGCSNNRACSVLTRTTITQP